MHIMGTNVSENESWCMVVNFCFSVVTKLTYPFYCVPSLFIA